MSKGAALSAKPFQSFPGHLESLGRNTRTSLHRHLLGVEAQLALEKDSKEGDKR